MEWFDDIVVSASTQPVNLVLPAIASCQDQYRVGFALGTRFFNDIDAGHLGQTQVHDRKVDRILKREVKALFAICGLLDAESGIGELAAKGFAQRRVVFDY